MPLQISEGRPTLLIRREAFERVELTRLAIDERLKLTDAEFRMESAIIAIGPIYDDDALQQLVEELEQLGLIYFDDFFELSGNWPEWLKLFAVSDT